ncbi:hypothetical protein AYY19_17755 [Photobacterium aquimaris]|nr:hypothetical protein AYY19_17755 [Photobacterium aquimaris]OBU19006.1 hypothetical protein AYY20_17885 [Photobacterium aquimaris]
MIAIFAAADCEVTREQVCSWLKADDAEGYKSCSDEQVATFLNGFINQKRGKKEGVQPAPETKITNNIIFRKLQIALNLKADDVLDLFKLVDFRLSKHELSAFFRKVDHKHYRDCKDQVLRNFLQALQINHRGVESLEETTDEK